MDDAALFLHLLGALVFAAGIVLAGAAFELARRRPAPAEIALLLSLARLGVPLVVVGVLMLGVFGLWLVHLGHFGYGSGWVIASILLFAAALVLGAFGGRSPKRARLLAARLAADGAAAATPELRRLLDDPVARATNYASLAIVVGIVALMVFK